ncbi:MAG: hypothetical protein ACRYGF_17195 [Janthinobacterium lividum]
MLSPWIVDVELVESDLIGVRLSDNTVLLVSAEEILSLGLPRYTLLSDDDDSELQVQ